MLPSKERSRIFEGKEMKKNESLTQNINIEANEKLHNKIAQMFKDRK